MTLEKLFSNPNAKNTLELYIFADCPFVEDGFHNPIGCVHANLSFTTRLGETVVIYDKSANVEYDFAKEKILSLDFLEDKTDSFSMGNIEGYLGLPVDKSEGEDIIENDLILKQWILDCDAKARNMTPIQIAGLSRNVVGDYSCYLT